VAVPSLLARRLLAGPAGRDLRSDLGEWLEVFHAEYHTPRAMVLAAHFEAFLDYFERHGWIERTDGQLRATEKGLPHLSFLAEQTRGVMEVYYGTAAAVLAFEGEMTSKSILKAAGAQFLRANLLGELVRTESVNDSTIANAIAFLVSRGILAPVPESSRRGDIGYRHGPAFGDLPALRERLAAALSAR